MKLLWLGKLDIIMTETEKLAKETNVDDNGKPINLSLEEKIARIKNIFRMISKLEGNLNPGDTKQITCGTVFRNTILIPKYIKIKPFRLAKIFKWLSENHKPYGNVFPTIPYFEQAKRETAENKMVDTWDEKYVNKKFSKGELSEAFKGVFEALPPKPTQEVKKHSQVALMRRMESQGKVYDVSQGKWVKKEEKSDSGLFVDPENALKKYKDSKMEVK